LINSTQKIDRLYAIGKMPAVLVNTKLLIVITVIFLHSKAWPGKSGHVAMHILHYADIQIYRYMQIYKKALS